MIHIWPLLAACVGDSNAKAEDSGDSAGRPTCENQRYDGDDVGTSAPGCALYATTRSDALPWSDPSGDVSWPMIDLLSGTYEVIDGGISARISVVSMPETVRHDQREGTIQEIEWAVQFDVDGDGTPAADLILAASILSTDERAEGCSAPADEVDPFVFTINAEQTLFHIEAGGTAVFGDDDVRIAVTAEELEGLPEVTADTPRAFYGMYFPADTAYCDFIP